MATYSLGTDTVKVPRDGTLQFRDSGGTNTLSVGYNNFSFSNPRFDDVILREQGNIIGARNGDQQPASGSFDVYFRQFTDSGAAQASVLDVLDGSGAVGSNWTKSSSTIERWNLDLRLTVSGTPYSGISDGANHVATFSRCIFTYEFAEDISGDKVTVSFQALNGVSYTGPA